MEPHEILFRLLLALLMGSAVAWIYRRTRNPSEIAASFPTTLILLSVLIAMVTQVIGDNIARAFSLVGALAIVRFRTVVRDTQDTAYVIFAVVVGMAVGARDYWVSSLGILVIGAAAFIISSRSKSAPDAPAVYCLKLRFGIGQDLNKLAGSTLDAHLEGRELMSIATVQQGISLEATYETRLKPDGAPEDLVKALNRIEGVQNVQFQRRELEQD